MQAEIITIGDEILIGQIVDTNSAWMATELNKIGVSVNRITSISDTKDAIISSMEEAMSRVDVILMTGGLGPTNDDITKKTLSDYFGCELVQDEGLYAKIEERLSGYKIGMNTLNADQALVPRGARIIPNDFGTAACMWFTKNNKHVISMPGVPFEMKNIMKFQILPKISAEFNCPHILHQTVMVQGIGESVLAVKLQDWEANLPSVVKLAYLPSPGVVRLRLSLIGDDENELKAIVETQLLGLKALLGDHIFAFDDEKIEHVIANLLLDRKMTVSTAESCTGGNMAHIFTSMAGSSAYFKGSVVAYSNEVKANVLGVNPASLEEFGAVSQQVVEQMATGACKVLGTDYSIATSGIAGPDGGTEEKPVGTVWIAVAFKGGVVSEKFAFSKERSRNIRVASLAGFNMLRKLMVEH
ncbi:competence/damage-inducible protein A [Ancylomarina sp. 16SWW S1-10-2]|uniref:competence/damage-inducible protein A n=1 Tax=Ancylomarina sp. 16SWW S1-10-2 TaxID=2499681 RepID=UPI0012ADD345|nr:competence/damage-inducible protein A [Ancylomarina sp. 16SWW S1-10-2]MRT94217.1 competence/damage-inducible protein A [Ancylomarina sp. 16SWW S1-10-2]